MKHLKTIFACMLMAVLSIGQVWGGTYFSDTFSNVGTGSSGSILPRDGWSGSGTTAPQYNTGVRLGASSSGATLTKTAMSNIEGTKSLKVTIYVSRYNTNANTLTVTATNGTIASATLAENVSTGSELKGGTLTIKPSANAGVTTTTAAATWTNAYKTEFTITGASSSTTIAFSSSSRLVLGPVTIEDAPAACTNTVTITKGAETNGTYTLSATSVCGDGDGEDVTISDITPATGYTFDEIITSASGTVDNENKKVTGITAATTITVTFKALPKYTVSFNVGGSAASQAAMTEASAGGGITLPAGPTPTCSADGWEFAGWAEATVAPQSTTAPAKLYQKDDNYKPADDCILYAVYKKTETGDVTDLDKTEGFETKAAGTTYNSTVTIETTESDCNVGWSIYYGCVSTNDKIAGSNSAQMRWYSSATSNIPYVLTTTPISGLQSVNFKARVSNTGVKMSLWYSTDGENWTISDVNQATFAATNTAYDFSATITGTVGTNYYIKIGEDGGTAPSSGNYKLIIDAVQFNYKAGASTTYYLSAPTCAAPTCENLGTPSVTVTNKTYNSAKLTWAAVENADKYLVKFNGVDQEATGNLYFEATNLDAETQYTYQVKALAEEGQDDWCDGAFSAEANFTTEAAPKAHLTLMNLGVAHASSGDYAILTPFNLPTTAAACSKAFVGWDANPDCATAPTYAKGAEFTFSNTTGVTLYAVYADETPGASTTKTDELDYAFTGLTGTSYKTWSGKTGTSGAVYAGQSNALGNSATSTFIQLRTNNDNSGVVTTGTGAGKVTKVTVTWNSDNGAAGITLDVYGKNTAYSQATDLYGENSGTLLGSIVKGTSTELVITGSYTYIGMRSHSGTVYLDEIDVEWTEQGASTFSNYSTTCVAAPTAEPASASIAVAAAGGEGTLGVSYENVNLAGVEVALYNNEACTEAFDGGWLTASIAGDDKHIAYTATENTSYNDARTAYIKLTAPETTGATAPAVVIIPVSQAKKAAVFSSLEELVAADVNANTNVTVSFSNAVIKEIYYYNSNRRGLVFGIQKANEDIKIYYNADVPAEWVAGGKVSGTLTDCPWKIYSGAWQLAPASGFAWATDLSYTAPKAVSSVVVSGAPSKTTYVDGEKFNPAGLTVTVNYNDATSEVNPTGVTFACDPVRVAKSDNPVSVSVVATFNEIDSNPFEVTGITVGDIQTKTVAQFIEAGTADMRCYLEGIVSNYTNKTKGYFDLTDASGTIYIYGCDEPSEFAEGDKIKVLAEDYEYYNSKHEAKNVEFVSKTPAATISIDDIDMETGDELALSSIVATITPAVAEGATITYVVTAGTAVSISEGKIVAVAAGEATITASIAEGVGYLAGNTTFTVTVTAPDTRKIAILDAPYSALNGDLSSTNIKYATAQGGGTAVPAITAADKGSYIRLYKIASGKNYGGYITFNAVKGCKIDQVQITVGANASLAYCKDAEAIPTSGAESVSKDAVFSTSTGLDAESVTVVNLSTSNAFDVAAIKVYYNGAPMSVHHYVLGGTYPTEFEQYGTFSYEGLTVTAAYDEQETITEAVTGFTAEADLSTAGAAKAEVYLGEDKLTEYDITVTPTAKSDPEIGWSPADNIVLTEGDEFTAPAWQNPHSVSVSFESSNTNVATVSNAGVITIKGVGTATITATFDGDETYYSANPSITVTVNAAVEDLSGKWVVATSVAAGDRIIIANVADQGAVKTMGAQNGNYRDQVASTVDGDGKMTPADGTKVFTLIDASTIDANYTGFALRATNGNYLSAASGSSNNIKEVASVDDANAVWSIVISEGKAAIVAQGSYSRKVIRYNNSQPRFSCYAENNTMDDVVIYKHVAQPVEPDPEPEFVTLRSGLSVGEFGTYCPKQKVEAYAGATFFKFAYMQFVNETPLKAYFDELAEGEALKAGHPYFYITNAETITGVKTGGEVEDGINDHGFIGKVKAFEFRVTDEVGQDNWFTRDRIYVVYQNQIMHCSGGYYRLGAEKAYLDVKDENMPRSKEQAQELAPGRRRVSINNREAPQVATGLDELNSNAQAMKVIINDQLFIIRGDKMYDTTGRFVGNVQ